jgi:hypothetical protein
MTARLLSRSLSNDSQWQCRMTASPCGSRGHRGVVNEAGARGPGHRHGVPHELRRGPPSHGAICAPPCIVSIEKNLEKHG